MSSITNVSMGDHIDLLIKESEDITAGLAAAVLAMPGLVAQTDMGPPEAQATVVRESMQRIRHSAMNDARIAEVIMAINDNDAAERVFNNLVAFANQQAISTRIYVASVMIATDVSNFTQV